jgi:small subunit ribosomal protein S21
MAGQGTRRRTRAGRSLLSVSVFTLGTESFHLGDAMVEVTLDESDRLDWALKTFKKKVLKSGIRKDLRRKRHYVKPSEARQLKAAAARRRGRSPSRPR